MDNETLFYVCGIALAASAVIVTFVGVRMENFPGRIGPVIGVWFALLVVGVTTFAVLHAQDEHAAEAAELHQAGEEVEQIEQGAEPAGQAAAANKPLELAADPTQIAFDKTSLSSEAGEVEIDFKNPAALEHNVAIEKDGKLLAESETITEGETSVTVDLSAGSYTFLCTVPGHEEAGMKGTLTVE